MKNIKKLLPILVLLTLFVISGCNGEYKHRNNEEIKFLRVIYSDQGDTVEIDFENNTRSFIKLGEEKRVTEVITITDEFKQFVFDKVIVSENKEPLQNEDSKILWRITVETNVDVYNLYSTTNYPIFWHELLELVGV